MKHITEVFHAEAKKHSGNFQFEFIIYGKTSKGNDAKVSLHLQPWIVQYLVRELRGALAKMRKEILSEESICVREVE